MGPAEMQKRRLDEAGGVRGKPNRLSLVAWNGDGRRGQQLDSNAGTQAWAERLVEPN